MKKLLVSVLICLTCAMARASAQPAFFMIAIGGSGVASTGVDTLMSGSVSAAATMDINFSSFVANYSVIMITFSIKPATDNTTLEMLTSTNGTTFDNTTGNYNWMLNFGSSFSTSAATSITNFLELATVCGSGTGQHTDYTFMIQKPNSATQNAVVSGWGSEIATSTNGMATLTFAGERLAQQVIEGVRLQMSSGNITGNFHVVGIRN